MWDGLGLEWGENDGSHIGLSNKWFGHEMMMMAECIDEEQGRTLYQELRWLDEMKWNYEDRWRYYHWSRDGNSRRWRNK